MLSNRNILIVGARSPVSLELVRSFKRHKAKVIVVGVLWSSISRWSNCTDNFYQIPPPVQNFQAYKKRIQEIVRIEEITDCIPTYEDAFHLSRIKDKLTCRTWVNSIQLLNTVHRKDEFIKLAQGYFDTPKTINLSNFPATYDSTKFVFKPIYSRFATQILIKPTRDKVEEIKNKTDWVAQEYISGKEFCAYSIWDHGRCKAVSIYFPLYRLGVGAGIYYQPVQNETLVQRIKNIGSALKFHGQISFDFILKEGKYFVIECNPRTTSGAHLIHKDLAKAFFAKDDFFIGDDVAKTIKVPLVLFKPWLLFKSDFYKAKDPVYDSGDLLPYLLQGLSIFEFFILAMRKRISVQEASTYFIEWNGQMEKDE